MPTFRYCLRLANRIRTALQAKAKEWTPIRVGHLRQFDQIVQALHCCRRQLELARSKDWNACVRRSLDEQITHFANLRKLLQDIQDTMQQTPPSLPPLAELVADLAHLDQEFGESEIDWNDAYLAVQTEPIVLEVVHLGPFSIRLYWQRLEKSAGVECFEVVALDPHCASANDDVTHPHVNDNRLCAGDAETPLERALDAGRIVDAFLLIRNVLLTYNPRSAYAQLDTWEGTSCGDCGQITDEDDQRFCESCESGFCEDCITFCVSCYDSYCGSCLNRCRSCEEYCCKSCLCQVTSPGEPCCRNCVRQCSECDARVAKHECDESKRCPVCHEESEPDPNPEPEKEASHAIV